MVTFLQPRKHSTNWVSKYTASKTQPRKWKHTSDWQASGRKWEKVKQSTIKIMFFKEMKNLSLLSARTTCISFTKTESFRTLLSLEEVQRTRLLTLKLTYSIRVVRLTSLISRSWKCDSVISSRVMHYWKRFSTIEGRILASCTQSDSSYILECATLCTLILMRTDSHESIRKFVQL